VSIIVWSKGIQRIQSFGFQEGGFSTYDVEGKNQRVYNVGIFINIVSIFLNVSREVQTHQSSGHG
jgi:hypothetical protein